ncbi:MAG: PhnD/SsuA/transferrin family substrate-binding protein [Photobacterium frigidiphilum]|uniref:sensor histidine kinase n=1 Tax=Photobacterium frigidiphilum TaxID=264736 RepID=UPI003002C976
MNKVRTTLLIYIIITLLPVPSLWASDNSATSQFVQKTPIKIGILAFNGADLTIQRWQPTINYLNTVFPQHHFDIIPADIKTLDHLVANNLVDFTITNGVKYLRYKHNYQAVKILNLRPPHGSASNAIGSVVITRNSEPDITHWHQLQNRKVVSVSPNAFGGFLIMKREFMAQNIDPDRDLNKLTFVGFPQQQILHMVANGDADFAIAPTCILENEINAGRIAPNVLKAVKPIKNDLLPCQTSSRLYPYWTFARMNHVSPDTANTIARVLLQIPADSPVAVASRYGGWTVPVDDSEIYNLLTDIGVITDPRSLQRLWKRYQGWIFIAVGLILLFITYHLRVNYLVHVRSTQLRIANDKLKNEMTLHKKTTDNLTHQQQQLYKAQRILLSGELTAGMAHELNQPLMTITTFAAGCRSRLKQDQPNLEEIDIVLEKMQGQSQMAKQIIDRMRSFMKKHEGCKQKTSVQSLLDDSLILFHDDLTRFHIKSRVNTEAMNIIVDTVLFQQVLVNLIRNSIDSILMTDRRTRKLEISAYQSDQSNIICIEDNGVGLTSQQLNELFMPFKSTKPQGIGLGMVICKRIINQHSGVIWAERLSEGLKITIELPKKQNLPA